MDNRKKVVFVCTHNAGKSRLAEAYLRKVAHDRFEVVSGGTDPSESANPAAVAAAREAGLDLTAGPGTKVTPDLTREAAVVVTFGCPIDSDDLPDDVTVEDWNLVDGAGNPIKDYGAITKAIATRIDDLMARLDAGSSG